MEEVERFQEVYRSRRGQIRAYLARRVEFGAVDDLEADVFAVAWKKLNSVRAGEELPWLYRIASYIVANHRRKQARASELLAKLFVPDSSPDAAAAMESDPELSRAWGAISVADREIIALAALEELPISDLAKVLKISPNAVSIRLHRAKKRLAELIRPESGAAPRKNQPAGDITSA